MDLFDDPEKAGKPFNEYCRVDRIDLDPDVNSRERAVNETRRMAVADKRDFPRSELKSI